LPVALAQQVPVPLFACLPQGSGIVLFCIAEDYAPLCRTFHGFSYVKASGFCWQEICALFEKNDMPARKKQHPKTRKWSARVTAIH
jgi:hypothetical protein